MTAAVRRRPVVEQPAMFAADALAHTEARKSGFVPTPPWVVRTLIEGMATAGHPPLPWHQRRVESGAGEGAIVAAVDSIVGSGDWTLCELRADAARVLRRCCPGAVVREGDYLALGSGVRGFGIWITNPDFAIAAAAFAKMREEAGEFGTVALHVPWAFAATDALDGVDCDLYPIEGRPYGFVRETCWIVTGPGRGGRRLRLRKPR